MGKEKKVQQVDYSIEYAHIYADERFGIEQKESVKKLRAVIDKLKRSNKSYALTVLIDEYNPIKHNLDIKDFLTKLKKLNAKPDFVGYESQLVIYKDYLLREMNRKIRKEYENYIKAHQKFPCSFLITIWYLKRLGLIPTKKEELECLTKNRKPFSAKKIITILPKKYREVEKKALEIIKSTKFKNYTKNIKNIFY